MNLKQKAHLLKLKKAYAYDIAASKPGMGPINEEDMYESLCLLDLSHSLTDAVNNFMDEYECIHPNEEIVCLITAIALLLDGAIMSESQDEAGREYIKSLFDDIYYSVSKDKDNEN